METKSWDFEYVEHSERSKGIVRNLFIVNKGGFSSLWLSSCCIYTSLSDWVCMLSSHPHTLSHTSVITHAKAFCYRGLMVLHSPHVCMFKSQLNSVPIFTVLIHKGASRPSLVSDLLLAVGNSGWTRRLIHVTAVFGFAVTDSIGLRSEFRLCPEASIKQDCGRPDQLFSQWRWNVIAQSPENQMQKSKHTHTHTLNTSIPTRACVIRSTRPLNIKYWCSCKQIMWSTPWA